MSVCIVGCGRSGTNVALEILSGNTALKPSNPEEDKKFFKVNMKYYPNNYLTKCDTIYIDGGDIVKKLSMDRGLKIIWTIRDPRDMCLSKLYRGRPISEGGDCKNIADDATFDGCLKDITHMYLLYKFSIRNYPDRIKLCKMENMLLNINESIQSMCDFLDLRYQEDMQYFYKRMRNKFKKQRYNNIDLSQIGLWKNVDCIYNGYFSNKEILVINLFREVEKYVKEFDYEYNMS